MKLGDRVELIKDADYFISKAGWKGQLISDTNQYGDVHVQFDQHPTEPLLVKPEDLKLETGGSQTRKDSPVFSGVLQYFPNAMMEISRHSKKGNDKHNPGQPLHWAKEKSKDHADCVARHLIDIGPNWDNKDPETDSYHATALAWRALALLETLLEKKAKDDNNK